ncbi:MAG TPA: hypothetical protein VKV25_09965 [Acidimicrobiales bacterium]|nr:hypothetical protein [Acidimicrobiales bacterium]
MTSAPPERSAPTLGILGLTAGEPVRWRGGPRARWQLGHVTHRERDGSIGVRDAGGRARSLEVERLEVRRPGPRGGTGWEPLTTRASRAEQLRLLP